MLWRHRPIFSTCHPSPWYLTRYSGGHDGSNPCGAESQRSRLGNVRATVGPCTSVVVPAAGVGRYTSCPQLMLRSFYSGGRYRVSLVVHSMCRRIRGSVGLRLVRGAMVDTALPCDNFFPPPRLAICKKRRPCTWPRYGAQWRIYESSF
jgi:hypothetical protein